MPSECLRELVERERGFITMLIAEPYFFLLATFPLHTSSSGFYSLGMLPGACAYRAFRVRTCTECCTLPRSFCSTSSSLVTFSDSLFLSLARSLTECRSCKQWLVFPISPLFFFSCLHWVKWLGREEEQAGEVLS